MIAGNFHVEIIGESYSRSLLLLIKVSVDFLRSVAVVADGRCAIGHTICFGLSQLRMSGNHLPPFPHKARFSARVKIC